MTKSTQFSFRVSPQDLERWHRQAKDEGTSLASLIVVVMAKRCNPAYQSGEVYPWPHADFNPPLKIVD